MPEQYASVGHVVQIIGPVVDIQFDADKLPPIYNAIHITSDGYNIPQPLDVIAEVQRHLGEGRVRTVAMEPTEGMVRGMKAYDTGKPIVVPVGRPTLGRVMNVLGKPVDQLGPLTSDTYYPIHRPAPTLEDQSTTLQAEPDSRAGIPAAIVTDVTRAQMHFGLIHDIGPEPNCSPAK